MIMRLTGILIVSAIVGACAATIPIHPSQTMEPIPNPIERVHILTKPRPSASGRLDPALKTQLDSLEEQARQLKNAVTNPTVRAGAEPSN